MTTFQINESRNFRGGQPFTTIEVSNKKELMAALKTAWKKTGMTNETGECFLLVQITHEEELLEMMIGDFVFYSDGEFCGRSNSGFDENDDDKWESIGYEDKSDFMADEERFNEKIKFIFKLDKNKRANSR